MRLRLSLLIVWMGSFLAPAHRRDRFRREWTSELSHAVDSGSLIGRAVVSWRDAASQRRLGAASERRSLAGSIDLLRQDVRFALRSLWSARGFAAVAVATIALGIGATTTIFSFVDGILLRPLPYPESDRLVAIWPSAYYSSEWYERFERELDAYDAVAAYSHWDATWLHGDGATRVASTYATAGYLDVLSPRIVRGRGFAPGDDRPGSSAVVVSEAFWRQQLGGREDVLGSSLRLDGRERIVVGVAGDEIRVLAPGTDVILPWIVDPDAADYTSHDLKLIGRLAPRESGATATAELRQAIAGLRDEAGYDDEFGSTAAVVSLQEFLVGDSRPTLLLLFGAVSLTLLIAAANIANLLLARSLARRRELSVRAALGAGSRRLVGQLLTETTVLSLLAAIPAVALARLGLRGVAALLPADTPRLDSIGLDGTTMAFAFLLSLLTGWAIGVLPALHAGRADVRVALAAGGRGASDEGARRGLRHLLVLAEIAVAVVLVAGAGLIARSYLNVTSVAPGLRPDGLVTFDVEPAAGTMASAAEAHEYYGRLSARLQRIPGVTGVTTVWKVAFSEDGGINGLWSADDPDGYSSDSPLARWRPVENDYLDVTGLRLEEGRFFGSEDLADGEPVAVVTAAAARAVFGDDSAVGRTIVTTAERDDSGNWDSFLEVRVIGVVDDIKLAGLDEASPGVVYRPYRQIDRTLELHGFWGRWIVLETANDAARADLAANVRRALREHDPTALFADFVTVRGAIRSTLAMREAVVILLLFFSGAAVSLGAIGVYGVMAVEVRRRRKELGIRLALGASPRAIVRGVLRDGLAVAATGTVAGVLASLGLTRLLRQFLFEVQPSDPLTLGSAALTAALIALAATLPPALRAARSDPAATLGSD